MTFRLPARDSRTTIIGATGSGKTQFASWLLSRADLDRRPWVAIDSKHDPLPFGRLIKSGNVGLVAAGHRFAKSDKGLYIVRPSFGDDEALEGLFDHLWKRGNCGLWVDELFSVPNTAPLEALYYQGRSKGIQIIASVQRPVDVTRFARSEATYFAIFNVADDDDLKTVKGFVRAPDLFLPRPEYHCLWYDAPQRRQYLLTPAPPLDDTIAVIEARQPWRYW